MDRLIDGQIDRCIERNKKTERDSERESLEAILLTKAMIYSTTPLGYVLLLLTLPAWHAIGRWRRSCLDLYRHDPLLRVPDEGGRIQRTRPVVLDALGWCIRHIGPRGCLPTPQCKNMSPEPKPVAVMSNTIQPPCKMRDMASATFRIHLPTTDVRQHE